MKLKPINLYKSDISHRLSEHRPDKKNSGPVLYENSKVGNWYYLLFKVKDTGIGIKHKDIDKLFKSFTQLDSTNTKKHKGTGLGLSITNELCKLMGGKISLTSAYDQGSTFYFIVPVREYMDDRQELDLSLLEGKTFLLVDDKEDNLERLGNVLDSWGVDYRDCTTGRRAVSWVSNHKIKFDLGLFDIVMPQMDGNMLADRIRDMDAAFPMIALTSRDENLTDVSSAFAMHIVKPYSDEQLLDAVIKTLASTAAMNSTPELNSSDDGNFCESQIETREDFDLNKKYVSSPRQNSQPQDNQPKKLSFQLKKHIINRKQMQIDNFYEKAKNRDINILVVEDIDYNRVMLVKMLQNIGYGNIDTATSGPEAVSMVKFNRGVNRKKNHPSEYAVILMDIIMPGEYDGVESSKTHHSII